MIAGLPKDAVVVLDFDGVLCDSLDECLKIAWGAHTGAPVRAFADADAGAVPAGIAERFRRTRPYMQHLGHFLVGLLDEPVPADQAAFTARYAALPAQQAQAFCASANAYRAAVRGRYPALWLAHHHVYPQVTRLAGGAYIATARDEASVLRILGAHGVQPNAGRLFGSLGEKTAALGHIAQLESAAPRDVWLVDDSVLNCVAARRSGYSAAWASWGYAARGHADLARSEGIAALVLADVAAGCPG